jgi:fumarate reductase flavoprotein subunit
VSRVVVAGAGMAGLCAAARLRQLGIEPVVHEKGDRAGGSMLLSSCVIWRYRSADLFREECPAGDPALQRLVVERLDAALDWLEGLGAPVVARETGNPLTVGRRFEPRGLTDVLVRAAGEPLLGRPVTGPVEGPLLLATGGYPVELARRRGLLVRSNRWSTGDGISLARARGAAFAGDEDEFYGRNMPAPPARIGEADFVRLAQLYGRHARVVDGRGVAFFRGPPSWAETDLVQATARLPGASAWYLVDDRALAQRVRGRTVAELVEAAREAGGTVADPRELPFPAPAETRAAVRVMPGVTHTVGGLRVDREARVLDSGGRPLEGLYAAGVDAGGVAGGGYASGLAQALVLGLAAAERIAADARR